MERRDPDLIMDQLATYKELYSEELPGILLDPGIDKDRSNLKEVRTVYAIGNGDSLCAAQAAEYVFRKSSGVHFCPVAAFEFLHYVLPEIKQKDSSSVLIAGISASGGSAIVIEAIEKARSLFKDIKTAGVYGKNDSPLQRAAEYGESVQLKEMGRAPGIRTYAASVAGLCSIGCSIGEAQNHASSYGREKIASFTMKSREGVMRTIDESMKAGKILASFSDSAFITCVGCGPSAGTAAFSAAKIVEASGVSSIGQDLEEWNHVESFAYPLNSVMVIFANPGTSFKKADTLIRGAKAMGHRVVAVTPDTVHDFDTTADIVLPVYGPYDDLLSPLTQYIPGTVFSYHLAKSLKRAMFMTDRS